MREPLSVRSSEWVSPSATFCTPISPRFTSSGLNALSIQSSPKPSCPEVASPNVYNSLFRVTKAECREPAAIWLIWISGTLSTSTGELKFWLFEVPRAPYFPYPQANNCLPPSARAKQWSFPAAISTIVKSWRLSIKHGNPFEWMNWFPFSSLSLSGSPIPNWPN